MTDVPVNPDAWADKGLTVIPVKNGDVVQSYRFVLEGRSDVIDVLVKAGNLQLFPQRSSQHRALIAALGSA